MNQIGTTLTMGGVPIRFPYKSPYTSQKQVMSKVINALKGRQNALLESPTGSGKSLAILCSVLAWHQHNYPKTTIHLPMKPTPENEMNHKNLKPKPVKPPKIIFTSRTHGQIQQLIAEYRRTPYCNHFQMVVLGSRKSLCINSKIQPLSDRNDQCKKARDLRDCRYYRNKSYADQFKTKATFTHGEAFDIEDLVSEGRKMGCCPYFGTHALLERALIIFCPYNYILDPVIRHQMKINIKNAIIIIDEAHNVEDVCRSALTKSYTLQDLTASLDDLDKFMKANKQLPQDVWESVSEIKEFMQIVRDWMKNMDETLSKSDYQCHRNVYPHPDNGTNKLRDLMKNHWEYDNKNMVKFAEYARTLFAYLQEQKQSQNELKQTLHESPSKRDFIPTLNAKTNVVIEYLLLILLPQILQFEIDFNIALLPEVKWDNVEKRKVKKIYLHFWCLSPSVAFKEIGKETHSVILTSGTLSPLDAMSYELKCKFELKLVADHVIERGQIVVTAIDRGLNGNQLRLQWKNLQQHGVQDDLGLSLVHLLEHIPQGIVVFFPSYGTMENLMQRWIETGIYKQMMKAKKIYQEPRGSDEHATKQFMDAIETFGRDCGNIKYINKYKRSNAYRKLQKDKAAAAEQAQKKGTITRYLTRKDYSFESKNNEDQDDDIDMNDLTASKASTKGSAFFGVCRGKISEGIDFSDGMSRAVILIGIPYPNQKDPLMHFKKIHNNKEAQKRKAEHHTLQLQNPKQCINAPFILDGKAWYSQQAFRALNQALGRCIRHKHDYGVIVFLESRFYGSSKYSQCNVEQLSKWVKPYMRSSLTAKQAVTELIKPYFEHMRKHTPKEGSKWIPPFSMPQNVWSKPVYNGNYRRNNKTFQTQSPANNSNDNRNQNNKKISSQNGINQNMKKNISPCNGGFRNGHNQRISPSYQGNMTRNTTMKGISPKGIQNGSRKRTFEEAHNENENDNRMNKRQRVESTPNCAQCHCAAMVCRGVFESVELDRGGGKMATFISSKQPFPCDTAADCIWSSQLGLTFMYKRCDECRTSIGFHVVGAMNKDRLQFVGHILFLPKTINLITTR